MKFIRGVRDYLVLFTVLAAMGACIGELDERTANTGGRLVARSGSYRIIAFDDSLNGVTCYMADNSRFSCVQVRERTK